MVEGDYRKKNACKRADMVRLTASTRLFIKMFLQKVKDHFREQELCRGNVTKQS